MALTQQTFYFDSGTSPLKRKAAYDIRNDNLFLRNQFDGRGRFCIPFVRKQSINLKNINLIACTNCIPNEEEYFDFGVHFFVDDNDFRSPYEFPEKSYPLYSQYQFCCTPDYSLYSEMQPWRQLESVAHSRWCGAWWQSKGMTVIPTISWDRFTSFDFCFDGVETGSIVAIATYACRQSRSGFMRGYKAMMERIQPEAVICYGKPFAEMTDNNIIEIPVCHPRQFHRELSKKSRGALRPGLLDHQQPEAERLPAGKTPQRPSRTNTRH